MKKKVKCWEFFECKEKECPVYKLKELRCWLIPGTHCRNEIQGKFLEKIEMCLECEPFKANMDIDSMKELLRIVNKQSTEFRRTIEKRDKELENISMELALSLSEVFEALKKISSGDPSLRIPETSELELITKLKHMVNLTAQNLGEIVDLSHEFAIVLAEYFDVLHRVSKGDLTARISGTSQIELLQSLKKITNQTIENIFKEITNRKRAEKKLEKHRLHLEELVKKRSAELIIANKQLQHDITKRKQIEKALRESEEKLAGIIESATDAMIMVDEQFNIAWINDVAKNFFCRRINPIGKKCYKILYGHNTVCEQCIVKQSFKDGQVHEFEMEFTGADGNQKNFWCTTGVAAWHENGRPKMIVKFLRDITERKQTLREVEELKQNMEFILGATKTGIDIIDSDFNIKYIDPEWQKVYGNPAGRKCYEYFMDRSETCPDCGIVKALKTKKTAVTEEVLPKEGNRPIQVITMPFQNSQGEWLVAEVNVDITERKRAEEEIKKAKEELERQNIELKKVDKIKDSLIRDVTHELKTPVAKHSMQLEILEDILQKHSLTDGVKNVLRVMETSIKRQNDVIRNILDLSRLEAGGRKYKKEKVHIDKVLKDVIEDYHYSMDMYRIKTIMELEDIAVRSDREMLAHIFSNIINNAIKYRKSDVKTKINIFCEKEEKVAKIEITDNGIGLSEEEREKAFDRFYQVSPSAEGSGVGLTISKMIVDDLGGKIWLESAGRGRGTTVVVQLPL